MKNESSCIKVRCHGTHTLFPSFVMLSGFSRELPWGAHMAAGVQILSCYLSNKKTSVTTKIIYDNNIYQITKKISIFLKKWLMIRVNNHDIVTQKSLQQPGYTNV